MRTLTIYLICCLWLGAMSAHGKIVFYSGRDGAAEIYTRNLHYERRWDQPDTGYGCPDKSCVSLLISQWKVDCVHE